MFPEDLTSDRLYTLWVGIREEAGLPGLGIHDCRHTWASQRVMNGVGLTTVGRLLGRSQRETTAIYTNLDDGALRDAAAQAAAVIARAMGYRAAAPPLRDDSEHREILAAVPEFSITEGPSAAPEGKRTPLWVRSTETERTDGTESAGDPEAPLGRPALDWLWTPTLIARCSDGKSGDMEPSAPLDTTSY